MKLVALVPFKNEAWVLPAYISSVAPVVDEIVAVDGGSTDGSRRLLEEAGAHVVDEATMVDLDSVDKRGDVVGADVWSERPVRNLLLRLGRERGGTHFLSVDADEALTTPCLDSLRGSLAALEPGQKLAMQWLTLWKQPTEYREDESVWTRLFKDFAWADVPESELLGIARTAGDATTARWTRLPVERGAVLHYQFVPWWRAQTKQAWYRCAALVRHPETAYHLNRMYAITLDSASARTVSVPPAWVDGIMVPEGIADLPPAWHLDAMLALFDQHGIEFFEPLQIWHVPQLHEAFLEAAGREPQPLVRLSLAKRAKRAVTTRLEGIAAKRG
jgi:hypothetical protein